MNLPLADMEFKLIGGQNKIKWILTPIQSFFRSKAINLFNSCIIQLWGACLIVVPMYSILMDNFVSAYTKFFSSLLSTSLYRSKPDSEFKETDTQTYIFIQTYEDIWKSYDRSKRKKLTRYEQELMELTDSQFQKYVCFFLSFPFTDMKHDTQMTTLLHIFSLVSVHGQVKKKEWILKELTSQLKEKSETDLYRIFNKYLDQLMTRRSKVVEEDLCIGGINLYIELLLKLCYSEKLIEQKQYDQYNVYIAKYVDFVTSNIEEMKTRDEYETMSNACIFILHALNVNMSWHQPDQLCNKEYLTSTLAELLSILPEYNVYGTFKNFLKQIEMLNSEIRVLDLLIWKIDPHQNLPLKLWLCEILMKNKHCKLYKECMVQNLKFFLDVTTEECSNVVINVGRTISHDCDKSCDQIHTLENKGYQVTTGLLSCLLYKLPEENLYETISYFLILVKKMKSDINPDYLNSIKTDPYLELIFKLFWCRKLINEGNADNHIVNNCVLHFYRKHFEENQHEFIALIISITDNLSRKSLIKEILQCFLRRYLKTVTSMATKTHGNMGCEWNEKLKTTDEKSKQNLIYAQCACIFSGKKMKNVEIKQYLRKLNMKGPENENEVEMQPEQVKLLILFILLLLLTALGHKSAKLKKYLALKYEYHMASLYLLWCSGDIEVHPGPPWKKKQLDHNSERERKWLQELNAILLKLYWEIPTQSKPKNLWKRQPEHWPSDKPFYDAKNDSKNIQGRKVSDGEILTCLLECLEKKNIVIPQTYQTEISAWRQRKIPLLCKLQVFRIEMENVKSATLNLFFASCDDEVKSLQNIKISLENSTLDKTQTYLLKKDCRQKKQTELVADITRYLACTLCRLARGKNPTEKCDGIWNHPPPNHWLEDVPFFNPYNRGKYKDTCSDKELVCTFLELNLEIPKNLKVIVDAYQTLCNSANNEEKKENKSKLCRSYIIQSNLEKLDYAIQCLHREGIFSIEVHDILNQWWATQSFNEQTIHCLKNVFVGSEERPHITINVTKEFQKDEDLGNISYAIPINDAYLHIKCTTPAPNQPSKDHAIMAVLTTANPQDNIEDGVKQPVSIQFLSDDKSFSGIHKNNGPKTSDSKRHESISSATHAYQETKTILDTQTSHNNHSSDINSSKIYIKYNVKSPQTCICDYSIVENM